MRITLKLLVTTAALTLGAGAAHAQAGGSTSAPAPPPNAGLVGENSTVRNGGDTYDRDMAAARDEAVAKARAEAHGGKIRSAPARPEDVTVGAEVRDSHGLRIGVIESVSLSAAVLHADGGSVAVPLEAFGKDSQGLLIGMSKADFDRLVADATKPAN
ncbi:hypothetical protein [Sphingomonas sp.]|uniref:hypothetical protein n=1 Tax=Sphingomonas sp. TaxID=28214 RepID=UPI001B1A9A38|nr:hypothetical protein [Sphingomonas sp.]MBO9714217.1 hypothetical protein [Sphingomonas sp.]